MKTSEIVAFDTRLKIDTHNAGGRSMYTNYSGLIKLLQIFNIGKTIHSGYCSFTVPISGIYTVTFSSSVMINGVYVAVNNSGSFNQHFINAKAGDYVTASGDFLSVQRIN